MKFTLFLSTTIISVTLSLFNQAIALPSKTLVEVNINSGTWARPEIAIATENDSQKIFVQPNVLWHASEKGEVTGNMQNNIQNATINQYLLTQGNQARFRILVNSGAPAEYIPTMSYDRYQLKPDNAFLLSKNQKIKCDVSFKQYRPYSNEGYWHAECV
ncbi:MULTISPECIES: hypothetical protein [Cysteiniphilum]|uniref:Uncharacterized protein n=1 Tax=Cysteiniphilum litorale TaxID=2056700 RepID=A0A8J2Z6Q6_9GAMM|nr:MULTISPECIES: hypothetical protein [Cysteiniphilum]GGG07267.1 hypothetical protein GCM10010995_26000 [Cysteiniphilum litorale]